MLCTTIVSRQVIFLTSLRTVRKRQRITRIVSPEYHRVDHNVALLVEVHTHNIYATTILLHLSHSSPTPLPQLDIIRCRYSKHLTYIDIKLISAISAVIGSTYIDNHVWIQDADMLSLFTKYIRGWIQRKCFKVHI